MTRLGYGEKMRQWRVEKYRGKDKPNNAKLGRMTVMTAGSKAEGLTCFFENDWDVLLILDHVRCVEAVVSLQTISDDIYVFRMDTRVYPGPCRLSKERLADAASDVIHNAL
ncbi:hypothetical protein DPMN_194464 [Dreissena polymorpha]|uniref:Uncharacterized protein n=1 Tax=Dreissena polymorpha TaxID=45954 RepID=A0A9D3XZY1_DREPO|nr:hypothetical protein DPMN_194464 [Dreissena polymorpha]